MRQMRFKDLALKRESCRDYHDRTVEEKVLQEIFEVARLSPSACNSQPWRLVAVCGEQAKQMRKLVQVGGRNKFAENVSTFVAVCETRAELRPGVSEDSQLFAQMDVGMVTMMLTLAAADVGVSTCILGCFDETGVKALLGVPEEIPVRLIVAMGYAREVGVRDKIRKPVEETLGFGAW